VRLAELRAIQSTYSDMEAVPENAVARAYPPVQNRSALILYGSETGNSQDVAEEVGRLCERLRFSTNVIELDNIDIVCIP